MSLSTASLLSSEGSSHLGSSVWETTWPCARGWILDQSLRWSSALTRGERSGGAHLVAFGVVVQVAIEQDEEELHFSCKGLREERGQRPPKPSLKREPTHASNLGVLHARRRRVQLLPHSLRRDTEGSRLELLRATSISFAPSSLHSLHLNAFLPPP